MVTVFVDRDGVINANRPDFVRSIDELEFLPRAIGALVRLTNAGHRVFIVTNQAAVGRGLLSEEAAWGINLHVVETVVEAGGKVEGVLMCTHRSQHGCACRKPLPGLLHMAREKYGVDLGSAYVIGDHWTDVAAGAAAGCTPILVLSGRWRQLTNGTRAMARHVVPDLSYAVDLLQSILTPTYVFSETSRRVAVAAPQISAVAQ